VEFDGPKCVDGKDESKVCKSGFEDPKSSSRVVEDAPFSDSIQVHPQVMSVTLRPGQPTSFNLSIRPAPNFPLDVYFLMDFSQSMKNDLVQMRRLAYRTAGAIRSISRDFTVGFGSFVDKKQIPMEFSTVFQRVNPCVTRGQKCPPNYSFKNHYSLSNNTRNFYLAMRDAKTSGNFDDPEGGTDALLQAVVCTNEIGWRPHPARHLLIYITDHQMHFGYDGKIAGVVTPHDGKCHLQKDRNGIYEYTEAERLEYPSLSMLAAKMQEFSIYPVFGVAVADSAGQIEGNPIYQLYKNVTDSIPNSVVEPLSSDSSNLVQALQSAYLKIATNVKLALANGALEDIDVHFEAYCNGSELADSPVCANVLVGDEVTFKVTVTAKTCSPELMSGKTKLSISTGFFGSVTVDLVANCDCQCSKKKEEASSSCSGLGSLMCGKCDCNSGIYGNTCQCGAAVNGTIPVCKAGSNGMLCSGPEAGECYCGECMCNKDINGVKGHMFYGDACECNNFECRRGTNNKLCSGHGTCGCGGVCECDKAPSGNKYIGEVCECYPDDDTCRTSPDETPCSGHGKCNCGSCKCEPGYIGEFCELCVSNRICGRQTCRAFDDCISCVFTINEEIVVQKSYEDCLAECNNMTIFTSSNAAGAAAINQTLQCKSTLSSQTCSGLNFYVRTTDNVIYVSNTPSNCVRYIPPWLIVVPIVGGLILITIFVIIFIKLLLVYLDYREYRNWMSDLKKVKFSENENPMFLSAWETFYCPMYPGHLEKGLIGSISTIKAGDTDSSTNTSCSNSPRPQRHGTVKGPVLKLSFESRLGLSHSVPTLHEEEETDITEATNGVAGRASGRGHVRPTRPMSQDLLSRDDDETLENLIMDLSKDKKRNSNAVYV
jgi:protocadherin alpha